MKTNRLLFLSILLLLILIALGGFAYFSDIAPVVSLKNAISKRKMLVSLVLLGILVIAMFGAGGYYFRTRGISNQPKAIRRINPLLPFVALIVCVLVCAGLLGFYSLTKSNQNLVSPTLQSSPVIPSQNVLSVNYQINKHPFTNKMLGVNFVNWEHSWGKPYANDVKGLTAALKAAHVGIIRYAGGNWSNSVGWDRSATRTPYTGWPDSKNGPYWFQYNPAEIDSVAALAHSIGADVIIEVNINTNDPTMWADMVKYTNVEHNYGFKYWELGNEFDTSKTTPPPDEYVKRAGSYIDAMLDVDPTIKITAAGVASPYDALRLGYDDKVTALSSYLTQAYTLVSPKGRKVQALTYHWYQACNSTNVADLTRYAWDNLADNSWRNNYSRKQADLMPPRIVNELTNASIPQGITEFNFDTCDYNNPMNGNFLNALWTTDVLGRMAYNGVDFATRWQGYGTQAFAMLYPNDGNNPTQLNARPSYYAYLMYANYFGDQMVESSSNDNARLSIWAAKDSTDPHKLKLMVTNLSSNDIDAPVSMPGFNARSADTYEMRSSNPADIISTSLTATVTINGSSIDLNNIDASLANIKPMSQAVSGSSLNYKFPAYSTTAVILTGDFGPQPTVDPNATPLPTIAPLPTATPLPAPTFAISATTSTNSVKPGQTINIVTTVTANDTAAAFLVDTEVYCSSDNTNWSKDFQNSRDNQSFQVGQTQTYTDTFAIPATHSKGQCVVKVGVFEPGWKKDLAFQDTGTFTIEDSK